MQYKIYIKDENFICEGRVSLNEYGVALAMDNSGKEVGKLLRANVEVISEAGILISGFEEIVKDPFDPPKYHYREWLLKRSQEDDEYEIYAREPEPICLGKCKCNFNKDNKAFAIDKNKLVIAELSRSRASFINADGIRLSGFEEISKDNRYRYQEWWLKYV
jgi:hypothetical protein